MPKTAVIMQPTYLSWIGYFDLIDRADVFVFLDSVQFEKRSWQQRNRIKRGEEPVWLTVPVKTKDRFVQRIDQVVIDDTGNFPRKHVETIRHAYAKAEFFEDYFFELSAILSGGRRCLADLNVDLIDWFCRRLGIVTPRVKSSSFSVEGNRADRLAALCESLKATQYLAAAGSREYLSDVSAFADRGVEVIYHDYHHPEYRQRGATFVPFLSAIDLMFNEGPRSLSVIRSGRVEHRPEPA